MSSPIDTEHAQAMSPDRRVAGGVSPVVAAACAAGVFLVPLLLSRSSTPTPNHPRVFLWYRGLKKPAFKPPDIVIPMAWTAIETGLSIAAYRLLRQAPGPARNRTLVWLGTNVLAIGGWSKLFFGGRSLPASTVAAVAMVGTGAAYVAQARQADDVAAKAGLPLTAWVAFAAVLTASLWRLNR